MRIQSLWRYPVKSLLGETLQTLNLDERGIAGDRLYAIADAEGKLGSGKTTQRFTRIDKLLSLRAETDENGVHVVFPDGTSRAIDQGDLNRQLSENLEQPVTIVREKSISHYDDSAVHVLLASDLARLQDLLPDARIDPRRFRANIVLDCPPHVTGEDLLESVLSFGTARLKVTHKTERCRMVTLAQEDLGFDPRILRVIAQDFDVDFGLYAKVLRPGSVSVGQRVEQTKSNGMQSGRGSRNLGI